MDIVKLFRSCLNFQPFLAPRRRVKGRQGRPGAKLARKAYEHKLGLRW